MRTPELANRLFSLRTCCSDSTASGPTPSHKHTLLQGGLLSKAPPLPKTEPKATTTTTTTTTTTMATTTTTPTTTTTTSSCQAQGLGTPPVDSWLCTAVLSIGQSPRPVLHCSLAVELVDQCETGSWQGTSPKGTGFAKDKMPCASAGGSRSQMRWRAHRHRNIWGTAQTQFQVSEGCQHAKPAKQVTERSFGLR